MAIAAMFIAIAGSLGLADSAKNGREADIRAILQKVAGQDPIERVLAVQDALSSEDPFLRSLVLEKALESDDRRVKEVAFAYLVGQQKRFVVELAVQEKSLEDIKDSHTTNAVHGLTLSTLDITRYDKSTQQFEGNSSTFRGFRGGIAQDGLTFIFGDAPSCKLQFPGAVPGYLVGALTCGHYSFAAKSALP
jgi:hypothetical protein